MLAFGLFTLCAALKNATCSVTPQRLTKKAKRQTEQDQQPFMPLREAVYEDQERWCNWPVTVRLSGPGVPPALSAKASTPAGR